MAIEAEFTRAMSDAGMAPVARYTVIADDTVRRFEIEGGEKGRLDGAYQLRIEPDGFGVGWFKDWRTGETVSWTTKQKRNWSADEKKAWRERREAEETARRAKVADGMASVAKRAARVWASSDIQGVSPYLDKKGVQSGPARFGRDGVLIVPVERDGKMTGLQFIDGDGGKRFLRGTVKDGACCVFAGEETTIYLAEGFSTAASVSEATGCTTVCAFDAGNLVPVAKYVRGRWPDARIVIAADNDLHTFDGKKVKPDDPRRNEPHDSEMWSQWRDEGLLINVGVHWAGQAAAGIGGCQVIAPDIHGDWNDIHVSKGIGAVRDALLGVPDISTPPDAEDWEQYIPYYDDSGESSGSPLSDMMRIVRPLGYEEDTYVFLPTVKGQIVRLTPSAMKNDLNLLQLMNLPQWQRVLGDYEIEGKDLVKLVPPALMDECHRIGPYTPSRVRGAGAWPRGNSAVVNMGDGLLDCSTGEMVAHNALDGREVYLRASQIYDLDCEPLTNREAHKTQQIFQKLSWKRGISATLAAGWAVIAPFAGAFVWRPHIFLTGPAGSGKTTVMNSIISILMGSSAIRMDGGSTEAGLRKEVGESSRPILCDELEGENKRDAEQVDKILFWARKASSGSVVVNANAAYRARSAVCFAAINPRVIQGADTERITIMELVKDSSDGSEQRYAELLDMINTTLTDDYVKRLMRRTIDNIDTLLHNTGVFGRHAARILGNARAGDQIGPMLAGAYLLHSRSKVTDAKAREWLDRQDWDWHSEANEGSDAEALMQHLLTSMIEHTTLDRTAKIPVSDLIERVHKRDIGHEDAGRTLGRHGIAVRDGKIRIANKATLLSRLFDGTPWTAYRATLSRYPTAEAGDRNMYFYNGINQRYTQIDLDRVIGS